MASLTDEQLVNRFQQGDVDSFSALVGRWEGPLYKFAYRFLGQREEARDVCQDTFLRVYERAGRFREGAKFSTWLYQIALNRCRDIARKRRRWSRILVESPSGGPAAMDAPSPQPESADTGESAEQAVVRNSVRGRLETALSTLPAEQREVVIMKEIQGLKFREIAEILGCPESTVKSRMYYGLSGLRARLTHDETYLAGRSGHVL